MSVTLDIIESVVFVPRASMDWQPPDPNDPHTWARSWPMYNGKVCAAPTDMRRLFGRDQMPDFPAHCNGALVVVFGQARFTCRRHARSHATDIVRDNVREYGMTRLVVDLLS